MDKRRVLLIDPDHDTRAVFGTALTHYGYEVWEASDGRTGLEVMLQIEPHLVISEYPILLPDGANLHDLARSDPRTVNTPFLVVTARHLPVDSQQARSRDAYPVLYKPVRPSRVVEEVAARIGTPDAASNLQPPELA